MLGPIEMWGCLWCAELTWLIDSLYNLYDANWVIEEEIRDSPWGKWVDARIIIKDKTECRLTHEPCNWLRTFGMDTALMEPEDWLREA